MAGSISWPATLSGLGAVGWRHRGVGLVGGGHLTSMAQLAPHVRAGHGNLGHLRPLGDQALYLNEKLRLDEAASAYFAVDAGRRAAKLQSLVVGSAEQPLLRKQTARFPSGHRARYGLPVTYEGDRRRRPVLGPWHIEMLAPQGRITSLIRQIRSCLVDGDIPRANGRMAHGRRRHSVFRRRPGPVHRRRSLLRDAGATSFFQ